MCNWAKVKIAYLEGQKVTEIAKKHKIKPQTIYNKALEEKWKVEKSRLAEEIEDNFKSDIKDLTALALPKLKNIITTSESETNVINAIKAVLDISGLKKETLDNNVSGVSQVIINREPV